MLFILATLYLIEILYLYLSNKQFKSLNMERIILVEKYNREFTVDVNMSYKVKDDKVIVTILFDFQSKELVFDVSEFDGVLDESFSVGFIEQMIFDIKFIEIKTEVTDWYEPTPQIDEMSDFDFFRMKI